MKKLSFRIISLVLILSLSILSLSAYAANDKPYYENDINQVVGVLSDFGVLKDSDKGYEPDRIPTKVETSVMPVRLWELKRLQQATLHLCYERLDTATMAGQK